jgi:hypothetical protein
MPRSFRFLILGKRDHAVGQDGTLRRGEGAADEAVQLACQDSLVEACVNRMRLVLYCIAKLREGRHVAVGDSYLRHLRERGCISGGSAAIREPLPQEQCRRRCRDDNTSSNHGAKCLLSW